MKPALVITHLDDRQTGLVSDCLRRAGVSVREVDALTDGELPTVDEISGLISLGGRASATAADRDPALGAEVALMSAALDRRVPVLGMCLGAQLLAVAAGGRVRPIGHMYAGWPELSPLPEAAQDPLFARLPARMPVLEWHEDLIELPRGAIELASTPAPGKALFSLPGHAAWGSQAHLELTEQMLVDTWLAGPDDVAEIEAAGHEIERFRTASREHLRLQMAVAQGIFEAFGTLTAQSSAEALSGSRRP